MVDALDSDSSERDFVEVQVLLTAPFWNKGKGLVMILKGLIWLIGLIKLFDENTAPKHMKYIPAWA